ncbi:MAG: helix-turn-helix domain-containing protein [Flavisolibacter sp.]|jgi:transcriptional regulator GlxA family with amidase domain|nr:helix-turn-helix domain-containing protein [Flavisolibacter sp.]
MKHVSILIPQGQSSLVNIQGAHHLLSWVNEYVVEMGRDPLFKIELVGSSDAIKHPDGLFVIHPEKHPDEISKTDLVIIPAIHGAPEEVIASNSELLTWIVDQYRSGAEIASLCIASFFLASTGLLNGKQCSTHWRSAPAFRQLFPEAILMDDKILTDSEGIYTSGGAYSFTNLLIYLVEKFAGREVAIMAAKTFMIDIERTSQSPFTIFVGQKIHKDEAVLHAQDFIEKNFQERISVDAITEKLCIGRRTFERRFKKATSNTINEYIQRVKIEAAKKQLETGRKTVNEVMYEVGYADTKAFRDVFKKYCGISPVHYRNKYYKVPAEA